MIVRPSFGVSINRTSYVCPHCGQVQRSRSALRAHVSEVHAVTPTALTHFDRAAISNRTRKLKVTLKKP